MAAHPVQKAVLLLPEETLSSLKFSTSSTKRGAEDSASQHLSETTSPQLQNDDEALLPPVMVPGHTMEQ